MSALTSTTAFARETKEKAVEHRKTYKMKASVTICQGGLVMVGTDGYAIPAADTSNCKVVGVADETVTSTSAADGTFSIRVRSGARYKFTASSVVIGDLDAPLLYVVDDNTVDETSPANSVKAGIMVEVISATSVWMYIPPYGVFTYGL